MMVENNFLDGHAMAFNTLATSGTQQPGKGNGIAWDCGLRTFSGMKPTMKAGVSHE
jgi:hypothetical protein